MVALGSRRALLSVAATSATALLLPWSDNQGQTIISTNLLPTILCNYTPQEFRHAVATTGCFLYRGETSLVDVSRNRQPLVALLDPEPDLLVPGTYNDPDALTYFQCLEQRLLLKQQQKECSSTSQQQSTTTARPSTGHIATSDVTEASLWGQPVSVWPLGNSLSYVWPKQNKVFFPTTDTPGTSATTICYNNDGGNLNIDQDLTLALKWGHEVLFTSSFQGKAPEKTRLESLPTFLTNKRMGAFLAVPVSLDSMLHNIVQRSDFTLAL